MHPLLNHMSKSYRNDQKLISMPLGLNILGDEGKDDEQKKLFFPSHIRGKIKGKTTPKTQKKPKEMALKQGYVLRNPFEQRVESIFSPK